MKSCNLLFLIPLFLGSCRDMGIGHDPAVEHHEREIRIQAEIDQINVTRADDSGFAGGDVIGVFAVDFNNNQPGTLSTTGNNSDNVAFTFDTDSYSWIGRSSIMFSDDTTPVDIYGYYPYSNSVESIDAFPISVESNQSVSLRNSGMSSYEASDFLWAKLSGVSPSSPTALLCFRHVLASVRVTLVEGEGFAADEWNALEKHVLVSNTCCDAFVDLSSGEVKVAGVTDDKAIVAKTDGADFRAIVIPQTVAAHKGLLNISVGDKSYSFKKDSDMVFLPSRQHSFSIKVSKNSVDGDYAFTVVDESITPWESDLSSHDGAAKEYMVVKTSAGNLKNDIKCLDLSPENIVSLKISGSMDESDFEFISENMSKLEALNLNEVNLEKTGYAIPRRAFLGMFRLRSFVFPAKVKKICEQSFNSTGLSGSLNIPEGVVEIESDAFGGDPMPGYFNNTSFSGSLILPNSLKLIGSRAFSGCTFSGSLLLPEGLEEIGASAFAGCTNFTGELHLPSTLNKLGEGAFDGMSGIRGWLELPLKTDVVGGFSEMSITGIIWPGTPFYIADGAFRNSEIKTDIRFPDNLTDIRSEAFRKTKINHVSLPPGITRIPYGCFEGSTLQDTIVIPENVTVIDPSAFAYCSKLSAIIMPQNLSIIADGAFDNCVNVKYIRCEASEPPKVGDRAFDGVSKDNFTVEVPEGSVEAYRNASGWSEFKRISAYRNFVVRPSKFNVLNNGGKKEIIINADAEWEMKDCPSWCHVDKTSGNKKTTLTLTVESLPKSSSSRTGEVSFILKGYDNYTADINVSQFDYEYDENQCLTLQTSSKGQGIDLVFIGDGYDASDISSGRYIEDMKQEMEYFFAIEPYSTYRDYFNVYTAIALSEDSGVESMNQWRNTKFNVSLGDGCSKAGQRLSADWRKALDYCFNTIPSAVHGVDRPIGCVLVGNSDVYEGVTYVGDSFCAVVTKSSEPYPYDARGIVQHEAGGHGFGWLGDEYIYHQNYIQSCDCGCCKHVAGLDSDHKAGFSLNVSTVGNYNESPWVHLIFNPSYGDVVDVYEGGYFHSRGVYRSEINSCMNNNVPYFSTWSRQLIVKRIMKLAGQSFSLEDFYRNDSRAKAIGYMPASTRYSEVNARQIPVRRGNPPIKITNYKPNKKGRKQ